VKIDIKNHTCLPSGREITEKKSILCVLQKRLKLTTEDTEWEKRDERREMREKG